MIRFLLLLFVAPPLLMLADVLLAGAILSARVEGKIICRQGVMLWLIWCVGPGFGLLVVTDWYLPGPWTWPEIVPLVAYEVAIGWSCGREWWRHRKHDEDCQFGPRRRYARKVRLARWRKVALRPEFQPA